MVMQNSVLDPQDQRKTSNMEDSSAMTIEFLRARLLSERSISRNARQRADELEKKVIELEEQLRKVTLQRKMAEKATADVLAILENQGISDISGESDLGSDNEITCDSSVSNDSAKGDERSTSSKVSRHASDELSGCNVDSSPAPGRSLSWKGRLDSSRCLGKVSRHASDELSGCNVDSSPAPGRSLSWKGRLDSSRCLGKYKTSNMRRRSSFPSISFATRHRLGKSCRRIKQREARSVVEDTRDKPVNDICQENEVVSSPEGFPNGSNGGPNILRTESETQEEDESELKLANNKNHDGCEREDMEKALEHRAQLIDQYEAMEKAQREWEEKFRENNTNTPDSFDMGNHSDITEERDESKARIPCSAGEATSSAQQAGSEARGVYLSEEIINAEPVANVPKSNDDTGYNNQNSTTASTSGILQEISHSQLKENQNEILENGQSQPPDRHHQVPSKHDFPNSKPTDSLLTDVYRGLPLKDAPTNKNGHSELGFHEQTHQFSGVLESLQQARLSIQEEINKLPLLESGSTGKAINPLAPVSRSEDRYDIPVGFSSLFRIPTDFSAEATARSNAHGSTSGPSSKFNLGRGIPGTAGGQVGTNPYWDTVFSADNQSLAARYSETWSKLDTNRAASVPSVSSGIIASRTHPFSTSHQNATQQMSFGEGPSRPYSSSTVGALPAYNFSFHSDHLR